MRNLFPIITVALSGCFYIGAQDERDRLALLDTDVVDTDPLETDTVDTEVGLELDVLGVSPARIFECQGAATLQVTSRVNDAFEQTSFTVFAGIDDGQPAQLDKVTSGVGFSGFANLNFNVPVDSAALTALASCGDASCPHDLFIGVVAEGGEATEAPAFPIEVVGTWTDLPDADTFIEDDAAVRTDLASTDFQSAVELNPDGGVSVAAYPTLVTVLTHPWFGVADGPGDWKFTVLACPPDADPADSADCLAVVPDVTFVGGKVEVAVPTDGFSDRACDPVGAPWDDFYLKIEGDPCRGTSVMPLEAQDFRFVMDDCDGDGVLAATDCDDADAARAPNQVDKCDGVDGNCDGTKDVELVLYPDVDGDGRGDSKAPTVAVCPSDLPGGVTNHDDCDDAKGTVFPAAAETCNGTDNNCSGNETDATDATDGYVDLDHDTFGVGSAIHDCAANHTAAGHATKLLDCNDTNALVSPDKIETCNGTDNNCSGDESDANDMTPWYADVDKDGFGDPTVTLACLAPAGMIATGLDCDDARPWVNPNGVEICDVGGDEDCDGTSATGCGVGDLCADDVDCTTGSCGVSGVCEPWTLWTNGAADESFGAVTVAADGRRIMAFRTNSAALSMGGVPVAGVNAGIDWAIVRADAAGVVESTSRLTSAGTDVPTAVVAEAVTGRYAVVGSVEINSSAAKLDTNVLFFASGGADGHPAVIVFDGADQVAWSRQFYDTGDGVATSAAFATDGDLFVGGIVNRNSPNTTSDLFISRVEEDPSTPGQGRSVWYRKYAVPGADFFGGVASAPGGDLVVSGSFGSLASSNATLDLGNGCVLTAADTAGDGFLARLDGTDGKCRWVVALHQNGEFQGFDDVVVDPMGRVCGVGTSKRTGPLGAGHPNTQLGNLNPATMGNALDGKDVVVGCVDDKGSPMWWRALGGSEDDVGWAAEIDAAGDLMIVGSMGANGTYPADFGTGAVEADSAADVFAARYATKDGAVVDVGVWPGIESASLLTDIGIDRFTGDILVAGHSKGPMDFGDTVAGDGKAGNYGVFVASLGNGAFESTYPPVNCGELHDRYAGLGTGVYPVDPDGPYGANAFYARCDMTTAGGGWTRIATMLGTGGICNMTQPLSAWTYTNLESAGPAVHAWLGAATVAQMFVKEEVRIVPNVGPAWIFKAPSTSAAWTWPNIADGTVNGGNTVATGVTASKDGTTFDPVTASGSAFLLGGMVGTEYTAHLGGGRAGHANSLFDQTTQCPQSPWFGMGTNAIFPDVGPSWWYGSQIGGAVWVR